MSRQAGWYWVKTDFNQGWEAAEFDGADWHVTRADSEWSESMLDTVGTRILGPDEQESVLSLLRFMCQTWAAVDRFVYENCSGEALMQYPVVQGTRNQVNLAAIGNQEYDERLLRAGIHFMLASAPKPGGA